MPDPELTFAILDFVASLAGAAAIFWAAYVAKQGFEDFKANRLASNAVGEAAETLAKMYEAKIHIASLRRSTRLIRLTTGETEREARLKQYQNHMQMLAAPTLPA